VPPPAAATVPEQGGAAPADHPGTATEAAAPQPGFTIENGTMEPVGTGRQKVRARSSLSGGRWRRLLLQAGISVALLVLIVNGLFRLAGKALYDPPKPPVGANYPAAGASGYAVRFAAAYLTWDENKPGVRAKELELFLPSITDSQVGWDGKGAQAVRGQPVAAGVTARDDNHAVVHIAADLDPGGWTCMDVAVYAAPGGSAFAITSYAAFVACPPVTAAGVAPDQRENDGQLAEDLRATLDTFFRAYAASAPELAQVVTQDSGIAGLGGAVSYVNTVKLFVPVGDGADGSRTAEVRVRWQAPSGGIVLQGYRLTLHQIGGRWFVHRIEGGVETSDVAPDRGPLPTSPSPGPSPGASSGPSARPSGSGSPGPTPTPSR